MEISGFFWGVNFCDVQRATRLLTESDPKMRERHQFEEHPQETVWKCVEKDSTRMEDSTSLKIPNDKKHAYLYLSNEGLNQCHWKR